MKTSCKIIEDLLPMYHDEISSEESAALIEEHLKECESCRQILASLSGEIVLPKEVPTEKAISSQILCLTQTPPTSADFGESLRPRLPSGAEALLSPTGGELFPSRRTFGYAVNETTCCLIL